MAERFRLIPRLTIKTIICIFIFLSLAAALGLYFQNPIFRGLLIGSSLTLKGHAIYAEQVDNPSFTLRTNSGQTWNLTLEPNSFRHVHHRDKYSPRPSYVAPKDWESLSGLGEDNYDNSYFDGELASKLGKPLEVTVISKSWGKLFVYRVYLDTSEK